MEIMPNDSLLTVIEKLGEETTAYVDMNQLDEEDSAIMSFNGMNITLKKDALKQSFKELLKQNIFKLTDDIEGQEPNRLLHSEFFSAVINSIYDGVYITDGEGRTLRINEAYERITGIDSQGLLGKYMGDLEKEGIINESISLHVIRRKEQVTLMQTIKNGKNVIVSGVPILDKNGKIQYVVNSVRDITELLRLKYETNELIDNNLNIGMKTTKIANQVGQNTAMHSIFKLLKKAAASKVKILLHGRTGVGKTYLAKYIHLQSNRSRENFLEINCTALPSNLIESELFGYVPGAFTGAQTKGKKGLLELAHKGTLFLDEIGDLPLELQVKLLSVIENQTFYPIGSTDYKKVDIRIVSASNKDIKKMVDQGTFREDLYYRLNIVEVDVPDLKDRQEEIIPFAKDFLSEFNSFYEEAKYFSLEVLDAFYEYEWPGNIRELRNIVEKLVVISDGDEIKLRDLPSTMNNGFIKNGSGECKTLKESLEAVERKIIKDALKHHKTTRKVADVLGVSQSTIVQKMKKWAID
ncbi:sigma-54 interaction domain-containing protein [Oceanobacillus sp. CF4.6]|uniref:sigma-54 interaction domain-containing protein n=1 Tax=Oceanobacillus sp. CF4.6 TaxID=3373080 RepID=UPI003EE67FD2